tara:strand:+ start:2147 stop:3019 length:873 start_codon:yes stop_codon:yes gene_type:complete
MKILVIGDFQGVYPKKLKKRLKKENFDLVFGVGDYGGIDDWTPFIMDMFKRAKKGDEGISPEEFFGKKRFKRILKKDFIAGKNVLSEINDLGKKVFFVFGNTDDDWSNHPKYKGQIAKKSAINFLKKLKNMRNITYSKLRYKGINIIGFGGYMDIDAYFNKKTFRGGKDLVSKRLKIHKFMKKKFFELIKRVKKGEKIFIFHYPPKGVFDIIRDKKNPMDGLSAGVRFYTGAIKKHKPRLVLCGHMHEYQGSKKIGDSLIVNPGDAKEGKYAIIDYPENKKERIKVRFVK